ncbi:hypothetical protein H5410_034294 [Solanum commersonii]|uniref:Uncharacterized protein n=1 Tax=Solanum commersonii TaxID=4109 RepID=A0A9J5YV55_SOLCO|nr:hypothetical protein H5410_034294 [Solanum commersonii]
MEMITRLTQLKAVVVGIVMTMLARHIGQLVCDLSQVSMQGAFTTSSFELTLIPKVLRSPD